MKPHGPLHTPIARRVGLADSVLGALGNIVISATLMGVRAWAWVSRTPYHKD